MDNNLGFRGKTLLFLDGSNLGTLAIKKAKSLGIRTVVINKYPKTNNPGKIICDSSYDVDFSDFDSVKKIIKKENIDGIMAGWTDSHLVTYSKICQMAGLPSYGTKEQFELFTQKKLYKDLLRKYEIPVVEDYQIEEENDIDNMTNISFPVLVKPSDGSGSRGIRVCNTLIELKEGFKYAKSFSETKKVIVEKYLDCDEAVAFWFIQNGTPYLTAVGNWHKRHYYNGVNAMGIGYTFPSSYIKEFETNVAPKIKAMLMDAGIKNGPMFFQFFMDNGVPKIYDIGFRLTGTLESIIVNRICGFDPMLKMIIFALNSNTGDDIASNVNAHFGLKYGWNVSFLIKPGTIAQINGIEKIKKEKGVIDAVLNHSIGDTIQNNQKGNLTQIILRVLGYSETLNEINEDMQRIYNLLSVISTKKENMLLPFDDISKYYSIIEKK